MCGWVLECDSGTDADLAEWLSSIGVDSDVADKVRPVWFEFLVHGQVTIIFVMSVCLFVCAEFFSAAFNPIWIKLGHLLHVRV